MKCKIYHSRTIDKNVNNKYVLSYDDIVKGIESLVVSRDKKDDKHLSMYL